MSDKTTDTLVRMMQATFEAAPPAPDLSTPPAGQPARHRSALAAAGAFAAVLVVVGIGILLLRPAGTTSEEVVAPSATQPAVPDTIPPTSSEVVVPPGPPHLVLELPETTVVDAYDIFSDATGSPIGAHTTYHMTLTNDANGYAGREILLRIQQTGAAFPRFDELIASAESSDTVVVGGREVTVYMIPDAAIEEGSYDQGILRWEESPGYEAVVIPWGMGPDEALTLMDGLTIASDYEWEQLVTSVTVPTTTTLVTAIDELTSMFPRVVVDLPGFEIVSGSEGKVETARWYGEWQIQIGDTTGIIMLDSAQTIPSETFVGYDTPEPVAVAGVTGLLVRHGDGFIVEWEDLDSRFTISIDGTLIDPGTLIEAISYVDEASWRQLLPNRTEPNEAPGVTTTIANTELARPYLLEAPGWHLAAADSGADRGYVGMVYEMAREGAQHPDRFIVAANVETTVLTDELASAIAGGPEWEGRVDGFGVPWDDPATAIIYVENREVTVASFTDYAHLAYWVDETGAGILVTTDRSTRDQVVDLIAKLVPVSWKDWQQTVGASSN